MVTDAIVMTLESALIDSAAKTAVSPETDIVDVRFVAETSPALCDQANEGGTITRKSVTVNEVSRRYVI